MSHSRSRRALVAVSAASSLVLSATVVPGNPFQPAVAQAATVDMTCNLLAAGSSPLEMRETLTTNTNITVDGGGQVEPGQTFNLTVGMDPIAFQHENIAQVRHNEIVFPKGNRVTLAVKGDVQLVGAPAGVTLKDGVLTIDGALFGSYPANDQVAVNMNSVTIPLQSNSAGIVTVETAGRTIHAEGHVVRGAGFRNVGVRALCEVATGQVLNTTEVKKLTEADKYTPAAKQQEVTVGDEVAAEASIENAADLPAGTTYKFKEPVDTASAGTKDAVVVVTYSDGSSDEVPVKVVVKAATTEADENDPQFAGDTSVEPGKTAEIAAPELPEGAKVTAGEGAPEWATVNEDGSISLAPGADVQPGATTIPVVVTYEDGSTDEVSVPVTVTQPAETPDSDGSLDGSSLDGSSNGSSLGSSSPWAWILGILGGLGIFGGLWYWFETHHNHHHNNHR